MGGSNVFIEIGSSLLLFILVFGMSATVETKQLVKQIHNKVALLIGLLLQFVILPFCGFIVILILKLPITMGITLLVITSSPGGSYSNWWCSMFNAELALSVTMTALSTILSTIMLPINLLIYARILYSSDVVSSLNWAALFTELIVVIGAITCGLVSSFVLSSKETNNRNGMLAAFHKRANLLGNIAGIALITLSITISSTDQQAALWDQSIAFYVGVAMPAVLGLSIATFLAMKANLDKPERVAVAVEACYQNTGIATSVAITMFGGDGTSNDVDASGENGIRNNNNDDLATAIGVPLYYGIVEALGLAVYCLVCWKLGWTKAPKDENICKVIYNSYEVEEEQIEEVEVAIEVVLGEHSSEGGEGDGTIIFEQTGDGVYVVDDESLRKVQCNGSLKGKSVSLTQTPVTMDEETLESSTGLSFEDQSLSFRSHSRDSATVDENDEYDEVDHPVAVIDGESILSPRRSHGRIARTISTIRARATGYRRPQPQSSSLVVRDTIFEEEKEDQSQNGDQIESSPGDSSQKLGSTAFDNSAGASSMHRTVPDFSPQKQRDNSLDDDLL